jgi:TRAP-type mannitol/chloroaromatic compound transport system permease small subunit
MFGIATIVQGGDVHESWLAKADRGIGAGLALAQWLVLPLAVLLFAQWPLRELIQAYSREANDIAQWLFALYVSLAVTFATRRRSHLAADFVARHFPAAVRVWILRIGMLVCIAPWSLFVLVSSTPAVWQSILQAERFPDTDNPGYFIVRVSLWLLALLAFLQSLALSLRPADSHEF